MPEAITTHELYQADAQLMHQVAHQDDTAWNTLLEHHLGKVLLLVKRLLHDHQEAEDVTQECFIRLWQQAAHWQPQARIATWLYRVAHNLAMDRLRKRQRQQEETLDEQQEYDSIMAPPTHSPLAILEEKERQQWLLSALDRLPARNRSVVLLVNRLGLRISEAAQVLQLSEEATASLLARSRKQLRTMLAPLYHDLRGD
ncbi:sigma-70 family RNA polymerase sigma factor [Candidatus Magnetaquicoccus inordinatus]|uniref:sigma-70 family RNA polymerase sigma factor n=1 Tax=Candidatus Magnetaquicoccus inordinatus TaxID=2496818 RepID=UPI00102B38D9|nr:sigma-70 family RNA polymerase sigma factor [Candidatus Magnetaquicoccus inordinatus]